MNINLYFEGDTIAHLLESNPLTKANYDMHLRKAKCPSHDAATNSEYFFFANSIFQSTIYEKI